jgi:hypothetical protein
MRLATQTWERGYKVTPTRVGELLQPPFLSLAGRVRLVALRSRFLRIRSAVSLLAVHATPCSRIPSYKEGPRLRSDLSPAAVDAYTVE